MRRCVLLLALLAALVAVSTRPARAADAPGFDGAVAKAVRSLGEKGLAPGRSAAGGPTKFRPAEERVVLAAWAKTVAESPEQAAELTKGLDEAIRAFEAAAAEEGCANDVAGALAFAVTTLHSIATASEASETAADALVGQLRAALDVPALRDAKDAERQAYHEATLAQSFMILGLAEATAAQQEDLAKVRRAASDALERLVGAPASRITISQDGVTIRAPAPTANPGADGLAPGFAFTAPEGWTRAGDWHVARKVEPRSGGDEIVSAMCRFLPAIPAEGNMGDALREVWAQATPKGLEGKHAPMVYRRFVGSGALAQFLYGEGREEGRLSDTAFTLYLVDCGKWWQPVVQAQTYDRPDAITTVGAEMAARGALPVSTAMAERMLATFRVAGDPPKQVATEQIVRGIWEYGSGSAMHWVNSVTGQYAGMTSVAYTNWIELKADGTFRFRHVSASGAVGAMDFGSQDEAGRWRVEGDLLVMEGAGTGARVRRHRIAGVNSFADGRRILSLVHDPDAPATNLNCLRSDSYASTDTFGASK